MKKYWIVVGVLVIAVGFVGAAQATWCNNSFSKRIDINVNNTSGGALTDYQVFVNLSSNPINKTSLRVYNKTDCSLRPHWCENETGGNCYALWINYSAIAASSWTNDTAIYYDNDTVSSASDGNATFEFFDDFTEGYASLSSFAITYVSTTPEIKAHQSALQTSKSFELVERYNFDNYGHQGVAVDGTYIYLTGKSGDGTTNKQLAKFRISDGSKIAENTTAADKGTSCEQVNGIFIKDGKLYIGAHTKGVYSFIKVYNADNLSYVEEHQVANHDTEGCSFHDGAWWVVHSDGWKYVEKYDANWNHVGDYNVSYDNSRYQSITWIGDYVYMNNHETYSNTCDVYKWNGSGFEPVERLFRLYVSGINGDTQQCYYDGEYMWWAERRYAGEWANRVSKTTLSDYIDGGYFYTTGIEVSGQQSQVIYKWNESWSLIDSHNVSGDEESCTLHQINGLYYHNGTLYVHVTCKEGESSYSSWIHEYNPCNFSYLARHNVNESTFGEGCSFHNNHWWCIFGGKNESTGNGAVCEYDSNWNFIKYHDLPHGVPNDYGYQSKMWFGDYFFANLHGLAGLSECHVYYWNGTGFEYFQTITPPDGCHQDITIDPDGEHLWWAKRTGGENGPAVETTIEEIWSRGVDYSKWNESQLSGSGGSTCVENSELTITQPAHSDGRYKVYSITVYDYKMVEFKAKFPTYSDGKKIHHFLGLEESTTMYTNVTSFTARSYTSSAEEVLNAISSGSETKGTDLALSNLDQYKIYSVARISSSSLKLWIDSAYQDEVTTNIPTTAYPVCFSLRSYDSVEDAQIIVDWARVRKYASPEPSSTLGSEEQQSGTPPLISNVTNGSISSTSQWIDWDVNQTAHNRVLYSNESDLTPTYWSDWDNNTAAPNITLSGLTANTQYWYQAWSYNTANSSLNDNSSTLTFTTAAPTDTSFTVTLPSGYTYLKFEPANSTALNVAPNGQTDSQEFFNVTNTGDGNLDIRMRLEPEQNESGIWHMDEGTGTWVNDSSGNDNNGTWHGSATANWTTDTPFGTGYALDFDGTDDYVDCGNDSSLYITDEITIEAWVKVNSGMLDGDFHRIASKENSWYFGAYNNKFHGIIGDGSNWINSPTTTFTSTNIITDTWYHVALVYDDSTNIVEIYLNGVSDGTTTADGFGSNTNGVRIGKYLSAQLWNGTIDEVRIYNRALSAEEIYEHYKGWFNKRPYNVTLKADTDNNPSGATEINTTYSTLYTNLEPDNSVNIWLWSDFNYTPEQDTNRTISINVTQST